jgi:hypothetical protein
LPAELPVSAPRWMQESLHLSSLVPAVLLLSWGRGLPRAWWLVGIAFAVSYVGDSVAYALGSTWGAVYAWLPIQFALVLMAVKPDLLLLWALMLTAMASWLVSAPGPDWLLTLVGSLLVLFHARGRIAVPLWIYFGAGSIAYSGMLATMSDVLPAWYLYQGCRLTAFGAFVFMLHREASDDGRVRDRSTAGAARTARPR